jgi:endonuclease III
MLSKGEGKLLYFERYSMQVDPASQKAITLKAITIIEILRIHTQHMRPPMSITIREMFGRDPFFILISCLLSLRARDSATLPVCIELFKRVKTPEQLAAVPLDELYALLYSIGFYRRKAHILHEVSIDLIERFSGKVPSTQADLLSIKGVGHKTAALVLALGFNIPALCVDIHVHRISNRLGLVQTKTPEQTEKALKGILPQEYWIEYNSLLVMWGQNICVPISPFCSRCPLFNVCKRVGVVSSR